MSEPPQDKQASDVGGSRPKGPPEKGPSSGPMQSPPAKSPSQNEFGVSRPKGPSEKGPSSGPTQSPSARSPSQREPAESIPKGPPEKVPSSGTMQSPRAKSPSQNEFGGSRLKGPPEKGPSSGKTQGPPARSPLKSESTESRLKGPPEKGSSSGPVQSPQAKFPSQNGSGVSRPKGTPEKGPSSGPTQGPPAKSPSQNEFEGSRLKGPPEKGSSSGTIQSPQAKSPSQNESEVSSPKGPPEKSPSNGLMQSPPAKSALQNERGGPSPLRSTPQGTKSPVEEMLEDLLETSCTAALEELKIASPGIATPTRALTVSGALGEARQKGLQCPTQIKEVASPTYLVEKKIKAKLIEELSDLTSIEEAHPVQDEVQVEDVDLLVYGMRTRKRAKQNTFYLLEKRKLEEQTSGLTTTKEEPTKRYPPSSEEVLDDIGFTYDAASFASLQISVPGDHRPLSKRVRRRSRKSRRSRSHRHSRSSSTESLEEYVFETLRKNILRNPLCDCVGLPRPAGIQRSIFHPDHSLVGEVEEEEEDVSVLCYMLNDLVQYLEASKVAERKDAETQHEEIPLIQISSSSTTEFDDPIYQHKSTCWHAMLPPVRMVSECIQTDEWMDEKSSSSFAEFATTKNSTARTVVDDAGPLEGSSVEELTQIFSGYRKQEELSRADVKGMVNDRTFKGEVSSVDGVPLVMRIDS